MMRSTSFATPQRRRLSERRDVIIVASVSCIYSLGDPIDYRTMVISLRPGMQKSREELLHKLVELQYERNDIGFTRNKFRVRGGCCRNLSGTVYGECNPGRIFRG